MTTWVFVDILTVQCKLCPISLLALSMLRSFARFSCHKSIAKRLHGKYPWLLWQRT